MCKKMWQPPTSSFALTIGNFFRTQKNKFTILMPYAMSNTGRDCRNHFPVPGKHKFKAKEQKNTKTCRLQMRMICAHNFEKNLSEEYLWYIPAQYKPVLVFIYRTSHFEIISYPIQMMFLLYVFLYVYNVFPKLSNFDRNLGLSWPLLHLYVKLILYNWYLIIIEVRGGCAIQNACSSLLQNEFNI